MVVATIGAVVAIGGRDIGFAAKDEFDAVFSGVFEEIDGAEHVAVIGDRDRVHAHRMDPGKEVLDADRPVEKAVLGVEMEVGKFGHGCRSSPRVRSGRPIGSTP